MSVWSNPDITESATSVCFSLINDLAYLSITCQWSKRLLPGFWRAALTATSLVSTADVTFQPAASHRPSLLLKSWFMATSSWTSNISCIMESKYRWTIKVSPWQDQQVQIHLLPRNCQVKGRNHLHELGLGFSISFEWNIPLKLELQFSWRLKWIKSCTF